MGEAGPQVENTLSPGAQGKQPKPDTADSAQTRIVKNVFVFGSAAQRGTETASSLLALQEISSHQESAVQQAKTGKKAGHRSKFGKFKVDTKRHKDTTTGVQLP